MRPEAADIVDYDMCPRLLPDYTLPTSFGKGAKNKLLIVFA